jgi:hypothetical protein
VLLKFLMKHLFHFLFTIIATSNKFFFCLIIYKTIIYCNYIVIRIIFHVFYFQPPLLPLPPAHRVSVALSSSHAVSTRTLHILESRTSRLKENRTLLWWGFNSFSICEAQAIPLGTGLRCYSFQSFEAVYGVL